MGFSQSCMKQERNQRTEHVSAFEVLEKGQHTFLALMISSIITSPQTYVPRIVLLDITRLCGVFALEI